MDLRTRQAKRCGRHAERQQPRPRAPASVGLGCDRERMRDVKTRLGLLSTVVALVVTLAAAAGASRGQGRILVQPAKFSYLPAGWETLPTTPAVLTPAGADTESTALSWHYKPNRFGWATSIPRNGSAVHVILIRRASGPPINLCHDTPHVQGSPKIRHLPLRLPSRANGTLEGATNVPEYRIFGRLDNSYNVDLRLDIKNRHPTYRMLRTAQAIVSRIHFPLWPRPLHC
jgi:hypothetical protein